MDIGIDDINSLADKLDALDLTEAEATVLDAVLAQAGGDEVAGFSMQFGDIRGNLKMELPQMKESGEKGGSPTTRSKKTGYLYDAFKL